MTDAPKTSRETTITVPPLPDGWEKWDRGPFVGDASEDGEYRRIDSGGGAQIFTRTRNYSLQQVLFALNLLDAAMPSVKDQTP
jgi:hypothetical protein